MHDREQVAEEVHRVSRALTAEMDAISRVTDAVRGAYHVVFGAVDTASTLTRQLRNKSIPPTDPAMDRRLTALSAPALEGQLDAAYATLMRAIEALPIEGRREALKVLRARVGE